MKVQFRSFNRQKLNNNQIVAEIPSSKRRKLTILGKIPLIYSNHPHGGAQKLLSNEILQNWVVS